MELNLEYFRRMESFFKRYFRLRENSYVVDGLLKIEVVRELTSTLLEEKIFSSVKEMRKAAIDQDLLILHNNCFDPKKLK